MDFETIRFEKVTVHENLTLVALVDENERVLSAGVFDSRVDAETAIAFAQTMLFNTGTAAPRDGEGMTPPKPDELPKFPDLLKKINRHKEELLKKISPHMEEKG